MALAELEIRPTLLCQPALEFAESIQDTLSILFPVEKGIIPDLVVGYTPVDVRTGLLSLDEIRAFGIQISIPIELSCRIPTIIAMDEQRQVRLTGLLPNSILDLFNAVEDRRLARKQAAIYYLTAIGVAKELKSY